MATQENNDIQWNYYVGPNENARGRGRGWRSLAPMNPVNGRNHRCRICTRSFDRPSSLVQHMFTHTGEKPHLCSYCRVKRFATTSNLYRHMRGCPHNSRKREANSPSFTTIAKEASPVNDREQSGSSGREWCRADRLMPHWQNAPLPSTYGAHDDPDAPINLPYHPTPVSILLETRRQLASDSHSARWDAQRKQISTNGSIPPDLAESNAASLECAAGESLQKSSFHHNPYNPALEANMLRRTLPTHRTAEHASHPVANGDNQPTWPLYMSNVLDRNSAPSPRFIYPTTRDVAYEAADYFGGSSVSESSRMRSSNAH